MRVSATAPVFIINLRAATQRRERMARLLSASGVEAQFLDAVDGRALTPEQTSYWQAHGKRQLLNPGEIGCLLSHMAVWRTVLEAGQDGAFVLEDDLLLASTFKADIDAIWDNREAIPVTGLIRIERDPQTVTLSRAPAFTFGPVHCHSLRRTRAMRTGGYFAKAGAMRAMLAQADQFGSAIDVELFDARRSIFKRLPIAQAVPALCQQAEFSEQHVESAPFLASSIAPTGARSDAKLGLHRPLEDPRLVSIRRMIRPIKHAALRAALRPTGWQRCVIPAPKE